MTFFKHLQARVAEEIVLESVGTVDAEADRLPTNLSLSLCMVHGGEILSPVAKM